MNGTATTPTFDPTRYLRKLNGKDYLEVVHRIQWLRAEHPDASITTRLEHVDFEAGWAIFHAIVEIPGSGTAEGTGSETREAFPAGWLEKAETVALGRALAALGYGTAFALADFEEGHPADAPADSPAAQPPIPTSGAARLNGGSSTSMATPAQIKLIYLSGTRDAHMAEEEIEGRCQEQYGRLPLHLTKREASEFIDSLKARK